MAKLPTVAIIGRPNTGKSTLFNRLTRTRKAIVSSFAGTTRDHVAERVDSEHASYLLLDTGGIGGGSEDHDLEEDVSAQSLIAMAAADLILFTVNAKEEMTASDAKVAELLRKSRKRHVPVILVATKCDHEGTLDSRLSDYHKLGIAEDIVGVSAVHGLNMSELDDVIARNLKALHFAPEKKEKSEKESYPRIAIVGKPNVGKSSLINAFMSDPQRAVSPRLVSPIPGTTRDSSDTVIRHEEKDYVFVDTAGLRRKAKVEEDIESISVIKSIQALQDADVAVIVLPADEPVSKQDKRIAAMAVDEGKGIILIINKSDLLNAEQKKEKLREVEVALQFCAFAPRLFTSAQTKEGLLKVFPLIETVVRNRLRRIAPKDLRRWYEAAIQRVPARMLSQSKHLTQAADPPPTFVLFVNNPNKIQVSHLRYLDNNIRTTFAFEGTPIRWITKDKHRDRDEE